MIHLPFQLVPRNAPSRSMQLLMPLVVTVLTLLTGLLIFIVLGVNAIDAVKSYFFEPLASLNGISELLLKTLPLCLVGLGLGISYRANVWNIGAEGQLIMGGIAATWVMASLHASMNEVLVPLMVVAGVIGGALWAGLAAWMRTRFNANEILTTLMLVYIAQSLLQYLLVGTVETPAPLQDPQGTGFPQSQQFPANALLLQFNQFFDVFMGTRLHVGAFLLFLVVPLAWLFVSKSFVGFQMKVAGLAPLAANYAGFKTNRLIWLALLISGALAGLAGALEVAGPVGQLQDSWRPGYGFTAIIVAFLGRLHPLGILLSALLMALLTLGGEALQIQMSLPQSVSSLFQGLLLIFLLTADVLVNYKIVRKK